MTMQRRVMHYGACLCAALRCANSHVCRHMVAEIKRHGVVVTCFISTRSDLISCGELTPFLGFPLIFIRLAAGFIPRMRFAAKMRQRLGASFRFAVAAAVACKKLLC